MGRYRGPKCKRCRREGFRLCGKTVKCAREKRDYPPGPTGRFKKKLSDYGQQLREKQKVKYLYGLTERPFRRFYREAARIRGETGATLMTLLERRLDNVVYRMGFASTRRQARQFVVHGHILLNGKKATTPSRLVSPGDIVAVRPSSRDNDFIRKALEAAKAVGVPGWLEVSPERREGRVLCLPTREMIDVAVNEQLIVELYSK